MLQPDAFCEHSTQQNATVAGALPRALLGELTAPRQLPQLVLRGPLGGGEVEGGHEMLQILSKCSTAI